MSNHSPRTDSNLAELQRFLRRYRITFVIHTIVVRLALAATLTLSALACLHLLFAVFPWVLIPVAWDFCIVAGVAGAAAVICDSAWLRVISLHAVARIVEVRAGLDRSWLSLALELSHQSTTGSPQLTAAVFETARLRLGGCPRRQPLPPSRSRMLAFGCAVLVFTLSASLLEPSCGRYWKIPFSFFRSVDATITPGTVVLPARSSCDVGLAPRSAVFPSCRLALCPEGDAAQTLLLPADASGRFSHRLDRMEHSTVYQFTIGNTSLAPDTITIVPKPLLSVLQVRLVPPSYTGLTPAALPEGQGNFAAYPGTKAEFSIAASYCLRNALLISSARDTVPLAVEGRSAEGALVVRGKESYTFVLTDTFSQKNDSLPQFSIDAMEDLPPSVYFVRPGANKNCTPAMRETLLVEAVDDIGISGCVVSMKINNDTAFTFSTLDVRGGGGVRKMVRAELPCDLAAFSLYPGDTLYYWASARDNRSFFPAHVSCSDTFFFRVPSFEEIHEQALAEQNETEQVLSSVRKRQGDLHTSLENLLQSTHNKQTLSWEQKQIASDLKQELAAQADSLSRALESFKSAVDKMKQNGPAGDRLLSKMDEVQKALDELIRQYGDSLLFSRQEKNNGLSMRDMKEALEKMERMMPDLAARLDNALKYLQALKRDQRLAHLAEQARSLAENQQNIAARRDTAPAALPKQEQCSRGVDDLLGQIDRSALGRGDSALFSKADLPSLPQVCSLQTQMKSDLSKKSLSGREQMNRMSGSLFSLSDNLCSLQSSALAKQLEKERELLLDMTHDALSLGAWQRSMHGEALRASRPDSGAVMGRQALKTSLIKSMDKMNLLTLVPPRRMVEIKRAYDSSALSIDHSLALSSGGAVGIVSADPELRLNGLAQAILDALTDLASEQNGSQGGASMMMQGLRRLSGKQAMLNAATGELLRRMLGQGGQCQLPGGQQPREGGSGSAQDAQARREAQAAQDAVAQELKRLADKYGKEAGASLDKKARELEDEARRLARELEQPSPELRDRQDRFLSRMIETTLSQHKQDEGKEDRKSESAKTVFSPQPGKPAAASRDLDTYYRLRQRAFSGNFPESYRFPVKNYFDSLGVLFLKEK